MEAIIFIAVVGWVLFIVMKMIAGRLYPSDPMEVQDKGDGGNSKDVWGNYYKADGHVRLFEQFQHEQQQLQREQQQRQQSAREATTFYDSSEWRRLRYQAFREYGNTCSVCGRGPGDGMVMHVDHIKPRSLYPHLALDLSNLQIMCNECNVSKSNKDEIKWR
ncbi:HNH endonuclease [Citrobacter rodentium]|uniref:Putative HNH nuclease YajD n=2 Tax=Citrobacter rodentium TaxID=67825 RepID=D2TK27_CITRI|nr:HNH endonuclease [Citrobacter rodentium]KIQ52717.1 HNH endonuclease [Citrobacter rodentium]QBY31602.1 HNH endonuclease [Citrobacter rodentium]CBG87157.1 putative membrane protein [Citrobacter rodentium ICC168]HAT8013598.1 HNH endonuclease [Citrobacter rodentium NBRC 105723 = DSM 16636]HAT8018167.1 HNH endonuclease [Citrobacter rodentium]